MSTNQALKVIGVRKMPSDTNVERAVLGGLCVDNHAIHGLMEYLKPEHFFDPVHRKMYEIMMAQADKNISFTPESLRVYYRETEENRPDTENTDIESYLHGIMAMAASAHNVIAYGKILFELWLRRNLIGIGRDVTESAYDVDIKCDAMEQIEKAEKSLSRLAEGKPDADVVTTFMECWNKAKNTEQTEAVVSTGFVELDRMLGGGLRSSQLIVIGGRTGMGKTAFGWNIAEAAAMTFMRDAKDRQGTGSAEGSSGRHVGFFSLEMGAVELGQRGVASMANIPLANVRNNCMSTNELQLCSDAEKVLKQLPLYIEVMFSPTISKIVAKARRRRRQIGLDLLIVDYLQLIAGSSANRENKRVYELAEITRALKTLAVELEIPIVLLSQLSRSVEYRNNKKPELWDLRDSGAIEQDADIVMFVYRKEYYIRNQEPVGGTREDYMTWEEESDACRGKADIYLEKQRNGGTGKVELAFNKEMVKFRNP